MKPRNALWLTKAPAAGLTAPSPLGGALGAAEMRPPDVFAAQSGFSPGIPIEPFPLDPAIAGGVVEPRIAQYLPGWNLITDPAAGKLVPFDTLRALSHVVLPIRKALQVRQQEISTQEWDIVMTGQKPGQKLPGDLADTRDQLLSFFRLPDPYGGFNFVDWIRMAEEEVTVIDALSIYLRPTLGPNAGVLGSGLAALEIIDGSLIRPLRDVRGGTPQPPAVAYQQYQYGAPRVDLTAPQLTLDSAGSDDAENAVVARFNANELLYRPFNRRVFTPYGFGNVESALTEIKLWLRRERNHLAYFDEGDVPAMFVYAPPEWSREQIRDYERDLNRALAGDPGWKHRIKVVPGGMKADQLKPNQYDMQFDMWLMQLIAMAMDVTVEELGQNPQHGLGGKGWAEEAGNRQIRLALLPRLTFYQNLFNYIIHSRLKVVGLEFQFIQPDQPDPSTQVTVDTSYVEKGIRTINEVREDNGWDAFDDPAANLPFVYTADGALPLGTPPPAKSAGPGEGAPSALLSGPAASHTAPVAPSQSGPAAASPATPPAPGVSGSDLSHEATAPATAAKLLELGQWRRWLGTDAHKTALPWIAQWLESALVDGITKLLDVPAEGLALGRWWDIVFEQAQALVREQGQLVKAGNAGNPDALIQWFNDGAGGAIAWGSPGDWAQCVAEASKHMTDEQAKGFCELRHQDATGMSTAEHAHEEGGR